MAAVGCKVSVGRRTTRLVRIAVAVVAALMLAACSSSKPGAAQTPGAAGSNTTRSAATGEPVVVGLLNQQLGAVAFPDFSAGAQAALAYLNEDLGGIHGRPLKFVPCFTDGTPEKSIDCANRFVDAKVVAVLQGLDYGSDEEQGQPRPLSAAATSRRRISGH